MICTVNLVSIWSWWTSEWNISFPFFVESSTLTNFPAASVFLAKIWSQAMTAHIPSFVERKVKAVGFWILHLWGKNKNKHQFSLNKHFHMNHLYNRINFLFLKVQFLSTLLQLSYVFHHVFSMFQNLLTDIRKAVLFTYVISSGTKGFFTTNERCVGLLHGDYKMGKTSQPTRTLRYELRNYEKFDL